MICDIISGKGECMKTIMLKVEDSYIEQFLNYLSTLPKNKVEILRDKIAIDLQTRIEDIESGKEKEIDFRSNLDNIKEKIVTKYAHS